jgi:ABC-type antimicrobial peptide transport system permease subunit
MVRKQPSSLTVVNLLEKYYWPFGSPGSKLRVGRNSPTTLRMPLTRFIKAFLVQVSTIDPLTFSGAAIILVLAAALGCLVPARRATTVDPIVTLRDE